MAGRAQARWPGATRGGDVPVTDHAGESIVERRRIEGRFRICVAVNPEADEEPITVREDQMTAEYPVVGVIVKPRRRPSWREGARL